MKKFVAAVALSMSVSAAFAQAPAPQVDPAAAQAVKQLLVTIKFRDLMRQSFTQMANTMPQMMMQQHAAMLNADKTKTDAQKKEAMKKAESQMPQMAADLKALFGDQSLIEDMEREMVPLYARHFTADELKKIGEFYQSPVGAKTLTAMPQIMNESMMIGQKLALPRVQKLMEKYKAK